MADPTSTKRPRMGPAYSLPASQRCHGKPRFPAENLAKRSDLIRTEQWGNSSWWDLGQDTGLDFSKKSLSRRPHTQEKEGSCPRLKGDEGFPGVSGMKNLPADAGDTGSVLDSGRPHMPQRNEACEPQLLSPCALEPAVTRDAAAMRRPCCRKEEPPLPQLEKSPQTATNPVQPKVNKHIKLFKNKRRERSTTVRRSL